MQFYITLLSSPVLSKEYTALDQLTIKTYTYRCLLRLASDFEKNKLDFNYM
jgi:hypothetical protein